MYRPYGMKAEDLKIYAGADWAGDTGRRKSGSCIVTRVAGCVMCIICHGQGVNGAEFSR